MNKKFFLCLIFFKLLPASPLSQALLLTEARAYYLNFSYQNYYLSADLYDLELETAAAYWDHFRTALGYRYESRLAEALQGYFLKQAFYWSLFKLELVLEAKHLLNHLDRWPEGVAQFFFSFGLGAFVFTMNTAFSLAREVPSGYALRLGTGLHYYPTVPYLRVLAFSLGQAQDHTLALRFDTELQLPYAVRMRFSYLLNPSSVVLAADYSYEWFKTSAAVQAHPLGFSSATRLSLFPTYLTKEKNPAYFPRPAARP